MLWWIPDEYLTSTVFSVSTPLQERHQGPGEWQEKGAEKVRMLGSIYSPEEWSGTGMGCPGRWFLSHHPWRCSRNILMLYWVKWFSGEILVVGGWLDWVILEVFSNIDDAMILWFRYSISFELSRFDSRLSRRPSKINCAVESSNLISTVFIPTLPIRQKTLLPTSLYKFLTIFTLVSIGKLS